jgi:hypothetical protein
MSCERQLQVQSSIIAFIGIILSIHLHVYEHIASFFLFKHCLNPTFGCQTRYFCERTNRSLLHCRTRLMLIGSAADSIKLSAKHRHPRCTARSIKQGAPRQELSQTL